MEKRVSKLSITADDLERRENLTKRLNRTATNRLKQQQEQFQDNHDLFENEINQEIKRIQYDLKGIREIGNYDVRNSTHEMNEQANNSNTGIKRKRKKFTLFQKKAKSNSMRKLNRDEGGRRVKFYPENSSQVISVENYKTAGNDLFNLSRNEKHPKNTQARDIYIRQDVTSAKHEMRFSEHDVRSNEHGVNGREVKFVGGETQVVGQERRLYEHEGKDGHESRISENETRSDKHEMLPRITKSATQEFAKSSELNVYEARNQARKRLLGENGPLKGEKAVLISENEIDSETQNEQEATSNEEIESYMYVPPDGRKRTVYMLPPLDELLQEARKARYLRMPKRLMNYEDDPERELSVDEIFSKSV